jgi:hypothetical protein
MIVKAFYVMCDRCGDPAPVSTEGRKLAREFARQERFKRIGPALGEPGPREDVCSRCLIEGEGDG